MRYRGHIVASILTTAALALVAGVALSRLPAGMRLPTHWGADGLADGFADARQALFVPVALTAIVSLVMAALPSMEPLQDRLGQSAPLYWTAWSGLLALMTLVEIMVAAPAFGLTLPATSMLVAMGLFFVFLGNALPKSRPGFFVGIRTPWTLTDPENWIATHRYASRIMIAAGVALVILALVPMQGESRRSFVMTVILAMIATPVVYSFFRWRTTRTRGD